MELPELPKKYNRREANVDGKVLRFLEKNHPHSFALEVKIKGGRVLDHQKVALNRVKNGYFSWKIPDMGQRNPFDAFCLKNADAILCIVDGKKVTCRVNDEYDIAFSLPS